VWYYQPEINHQHAELWPHGQDWHYAGVLVEECFCIGSLFNNLKNTSIVLDTDIIHRADKRVK
jgi:hypothetical protein